MPTASSTPVPPLDAGAPDEEQEPERWLVLESGERVRVTVWPLEIRSAPRPSGTSLSSARFLVFQSTAAAPRQFVRIATGVALDRIQPGELWALYKRARSFTPATRRR